MSGRIVPFAGMLTVFAVLPFLGGSAPAPERADVVLAAGAPAQAAAQDIAGVVDAARRGLAGQGTSALLGNATAVGGGSAAFSGASGLFMFPSITLAPLTTQAIVAPIVGTLAPGGFIHPVPGAEVSPFGPRIHPVLGRAMFHTGIDLQAACGTPIRAAADGTVAYARVSNSWGLRTIIEHRSGVKTAYGHQSMFLVKEGDVVKQGQVIGLVGTTGWSTGCHLHFDVIINDRYVDPAPYLGFPASSADSIPYAVVPHFVLDQSGRTVQTVQDGDVEIPTQGTSGSSSSADRSSGTSTSTPTSTSTGTSTTTPPTSTSTSTSSGTSTGTGSSTGTSSSTSTTGTSTGTGSSTSTGTSSSSTTSTGTPTSSTTTTPPPPPPPPPTTTSEPPATTSDPPTTTSASSTTAAEPPPTSTSESTSSAEQAVATTSSDPTSQSAASDATTADASTTGDSTTSSGTTADPTP